LLRLSSTVLQDQPGRELVDVTNYALRAGINACGPGRSFKGIGQAIHNVLGENYSVSSQFIGHGIGTFFHTRPWILHHSELTKPLGCGMISINISLP
jgi:methionine aminopeptidase